jgi:zinc and cadmium transporter
MTTFAVALGLSIVGSVGALAVAAGLLLFSDSVRVRLVPWLISYAVGTLLGAALLGLLPRAL